MRAPRFLILLVLVGCSAAGIQIGSAPSATATATTADDGHTDQQHHRQANHLHLSLLTADGPRRNRIRALPDVVPPW